MQQIIDFNSERYNELKKNPVLFLKFHENYQTGSQGKKIDNSQWRSVDRDLGISFEAGKFGNRLLGYCLIIIDDAKPKKDEKGNEVSDIISMRLHAANSNNLNDWICIINNFIIRNNDPEDKFAFMELLWFLDKEFGNQDALINALRRYPPKSIPFLIRKLNLIGRCLSINKQKVLQKVCESFGNIYSIYVPKMVSEAYKILFPEKSDVNELNLFEIVDAIISSEKRDIIDDYSGSNSVLILLQWIHSNYVFNDYSQLKSLYSIVSEETRMNIVKRYFHDIRNGLATLDIDLLNQFKDNPYQDFIRFRYCIESPAERIVLTVPLLCDSLITIYNSKGKSFQTFDGILDFAMMHCDKAHPGIDFQMNRFLPVCNNGAVYNANSFKGFIDYSLIRKIENDKLTEENLKTAICQLLDLYGRRATYPVCSFDNEDELSADIVKKCSIVRNAKTNKQFKLECLVQKKYDNKWIVSTDKAYVLNTLLTTPLQDFSKPNDDIVVTLDMTSTLVLKEYICSLPEKFEHLPDGQFVVPSYKNSAKNNDLYLIEQFSKITRMRIFPQREALAGLSFDVFGIWKRMKSQYSCKYLSDSSFIKRKHEEYRSEESLEVKRRTIESLKIELDTDMVDNQYFDLLYDREKLISIIHKFYFKESFHEKDAISMHEFLTPSYSIGNFKPYCAPQLSPEKNPAINLPYFWCRGKECFHNNLGDQTLAECLDWNNYSLYHLMEIIGYPKLHQTEAGYEPDSTVWQFIAVTNKVMQKFRRLKCRSCGHIMFTERTGRFNRNNYYACINPICSEVNKAIYLNFCYQCKKGLIDSRDTKQCPNGWYICPTCLACCNDAQYERLAQRYVIINQSIPTRIKEKIGCGHNDKGEYFCPICGGPIEMLADEHEVTHRICSTCSRIFDETLEEYPY